MKDIAKIFEAFSNIPHPGRPKLTDSDCPCPDCSFESLDELSDAEWNTITFRDLWKMDDECFLSAILKLSPEAFLHFIPEIVKRIVEEDDATLANHFLSRFSYYETAGSAHEIGRTIQLLDKKQKKALIDFITSLSRYDTICPHILDVAVKNIETGAITRCSSDIIKNWAEETIKKYRKNR